MKTKNKITKFLYCAPLLVLIFLGIPSITTATTDFVTIINNSDDWFRTPYPYTSGVFADLEDVDKGQNGDGVLTCNEACFDNGYKSCSYSVMAYHHPNGVTDYFKFGTGINSQINLNQAIKDFANHHRIKRMLSC